MNYDEFTLKWNGRGVDVDGYYGYQCFDLAHRYAIDVVGIDIPAAPAAKDLWNMTINGYDKIPNTPTGVPLKGDIIIWGTGLGPYGHVAIFSEGDVNQFTSFDQNFPTGTLCHFQKHNYTGVLGWFHPKQLPSSDMISVPKKDFENLVSKSGKYDEFVKMGFSSAQDASTKVNELNNRINGLQSKIDAARKDLS